MDDSVKTFYGKMTFDGKHCFLCGDAFNEDNSTDEHIFPKWLQSRNNLWNQTLKILNGTTIRYRQLTVPCCKNCNGTHLSKIENDMKIAIESGIDAVRVMDKTIIYKWVIKILYCILYKQLTLKNDLKSKNSETIINPNFLSQYKLIFDCMQSIRTGAKLDETLSSIFIFDVLKCYNNASRDFFYVDDILHAQFAMETSGIGLICSIGDAKAIEYRLKDYFFPFYKLKLSNFQFGQLIADVFYNRTLLRDSFTGIFMPNQIVQVPSWVSSYKDYSQKEYALVLYHILQHYHFQFEDLYSEKDDATMNFLIDENRRIIVYNSDGTYYKGEIHSSFAGDVLKETKIKGYSSFANPNL